MTSTIASYAAGDLSHYALGEESRKITGKKRRTVYSSAARPLFVAEAEFRASKVFTRSKKGMLALYGTDMHVVDVLGLEAADVSSGSADAASHVLRWVHYIDLLDISFTGPATLRIQHGDTSDKPKVMGVGETLAAAAAAEGGDTAASAQGACCVSMGGASVATSAAAPTSSASVRVTYDSFTLTFRDAGVAQQAAAALLFQQAQYAAVRHWLRMGLHAGFRCDLVSINALPLLFNDSQHPGNALGSLGGSGLARNHSLLPPHVLYSCASGNFGRSSLPGCATSSSSSAAAAAGASAGSSAGAGAGSTAGAASAAGAAAAVPYPWGDAGSQDWGCSVPLPAGWGPVLDAVAVAASAGGAGHGDDAPGATPEELTCPVVLDQGPKALQVTLSTPLGAAVATITPQLAKAALCHPTCRDILALPLHPNSSSSSTDASSSSAAPMAAFTWSVQGRVSTAAGAAAGPDGSASSSSNNMLSAGLEADDRASSVSSAGAQSSGGLPLAYTMDAFASLSIQVVQTPSTANTRGAGRLFCPEGTAASTPRQQNPSRQPGPAAAAAPGATAGGAAVGGAAAEGAGVAGSESSSWQLNSSMQVQLAVCAVLAAVAVQQSFHQLWVLLLQMLLPAVVAAAAIVTDQSSSSSSSNSSNTAATAGQQEATAAAAAWQSSKDSSSISSENIHCCGWSIVLVGADLCSTPSRHLQLQVSLAKASKGMARLRLRLASMSTGGAPVQLLGGPIDDADDESMPVLVSDPEPVWLNTDTKQRFINAKPTLEASQEQARRTDKWRRQMDVDTVLMRPCPKFPLMCRLLPTYLLSDNSPEGHAVVLMKVGGVKDLCDAIFQTPEGSPDGLTFLEAEHTLALLNEYLVQIAAPKALPAGFQVQIYDLAGFKLSHVMGDMFTLFKLLVRFGLYYPERLRMALVINAPAWFSTPWKAMSAFMDENTSAKVVVVGSPKSALSTIAGMSVSPGV